MWKKLMSEKKVCSPVETMNVLSLQWTRNTMFFQSVKDLNWGLNDTMTRWQRTRRVKSEFTFTSLYRDYSCPFSLSKRGEPFWS